MAIERSYGRRRARRWIGGAFALCAFGIMGSSAPVGTVWSGAEPAVARRADEPIAPLTAVPAGDPLRIALGARLFDDPRLSRDGSLSCNTCHNIHDNGASRTAHDLGLDGRPLPLNTLSVFNAGANYRLTWTGEHRTLEQQVAASLENPRIMGTSASEAAARIATDPELQQQFQKTYGRPPDGEAVIDAIAAFERSLLTPGSRFDRWLLGDDTALTKTELDGYQLFKSLGCVSCHQGVNIGGNLIERHGIFHPLGSPEPVLLRVPSLRNVAQTPPYFHDGSAASLEEAVRKMGYAQLNTRLQPTEIESIVAFLRTLTGTYEGRPVGRGQ